MKGALLVMGISLVMGQQFQQVRQVSSPAVLLASSGDFRQERRDFQGNQFNNNFQENTQAQNFRQTGFQSNQEGRFSLDSQRKFQQENQNSQFRLNDFAQDRRQEFSNQQNLFRQAEGAQFLEGDFEPLNLPSGASLLMGQIDTSFQCADRPYGYYADERNECRVFHVCNPYLFSDGRIETHQYSFMCGEGRVFDQEKLTCVEEFAAIPCQESSFHYSKNTEFGLPEEKF
ncbi:uncharacterized protein LOC143021433 [Oratosquilla oratoria]|uniref:uncharacterized protein LOC143021433 n=1 Tax=Oratosquilla oratoria TaxID=337810 RepID=UPI003F75C9CB